MNSSYLSSIHWSQTGYFPLNDLYSLQHETTKYYKNVSNNELRRHSLSNRDPSSMPKIISMEMKKKVPMETQNESNCQQPILSWRNAHVESYPTVDTKPIETQATRNKSGSNIVKDRINFFNKMATTDSPITASRTLPRRRLSIRNNDKSCLKHVYKQDNRTNSLQSNNRGHNKPFEKSFEELQGNNFKQRAPLTALNQSLSSTSTLVDIPTSFISVKKRIAEIEKKISI